MRMVYSEVLESVQKNKSTTIFILLQITILFFLVTVLFLNFNHLVTKSSKTAALGAQDSFQLSDTLTNSDELKKLMNQPMFLTKIKNFYNYVEKHIGEKYIYIFTQPVDLIHFEGADKAKFSQDYEQGFEPNVFTINNKGPYVSIKALQINKQGLDQFSIETDEGENLTAHDFNHVGHTSIPVLLGAEYKQLYKAGDILKGKYLFKDFEFYVKGFVKKDSLVFNANNPEIYLDRYIIMPAQQFTSVPDTKEDFNFQQKHYLQMINGDIWSSETEYFVRSKVEEAQKKTGFYDTQVLGANSPPLNFIFSALHENIMVLSVIAITIFVVCILSISILMVTKLEKNMKNLSIHLISGATIMNILFYFIAEIAFLVIVPGLISLFLYTYFINFKMGSYFITILLSMLIIFALSTLLLYYKIRKLQVSMFLKRME
ncbi:ABC transporter [Paenibacillus jamilae]|uniref:ABC transporter permease n=1 Tax=Paenibacillus jamilae TaxID=114136 RepID=UPI003D28CD11